MFTEDEIQVTADHLVRPIMVPRDINILPWYSGYAEAINAGKSLRNEDQAAFHRGVLRTCDLPTDIECQEECEIPYVYFGTFDGHAGSGCAVAAANELHQVVHKRLMSVLHHLLPEGGANASCSQNVLWFPSRDISTESLIIGALEAAFWEMDQQIGDDKTRYKMLGGCTVIVSLFILGKLYVANAGDSRGILCRDNVPYPMSYDFTPVSERQRLQQLGYQKPQLLGGEYTHLDYCRRPMRKDVGKKMLYRDQHMTGWTYKEITQEDLKFPVVYGEGKRSRLLATIGVTRGFGDHDLKAQSQNGFVYIKPFLTPQPEVRVLDVEREAIGDADVLVMATDGLWDVVTNDRVAEIVAAGLKLYEDADEIRKRYRFISIAQDLVMAARGKLVERTWRRNDGTAATIDDISVLVIPILAYKEEYKDWLEQRQRIKEERVRQRQQQQESPVLSQQQQQDSDNNGKVSPPPLVPVSGEGRVSRQSSSEDIEDEIEREIGSAAAEAETAEQAVPTGDGYGLCLSKIDDDNNEGGEEEEGEK